MTSFTQATLSTMPGVERVAAWNDRLYVTLRGVSGSAKADRTTKVWAKGDTLTIETGKGYNSDGFADAKYALIAAVRATGAQVREI